MNKFGTKIRSGLAAVAYAGVALGSVAIILSASASASERGVEVGVDIGDAQVMLGAQSARVVERVDYRAGVRRIADVVIENGVPLSAIVNPDVERAWEIIDSVWPTSLRSELRQVSVIDEGPRGLVGVVHRSATGGWILSIDRADLADQSLVRETIIHEIAHVATLGTSSFTFDKTAGCDGVAIAVGCAFPGTLMARYAERFWPGNEVDAPAEALVDPYAATAPHEDLAETFTAWVAGWPVVSVDVAARIDMMSSDPRLSVLAEEIRDRLG